MNHNELLFIVITYEKGVNPLYFISSAFNANGKVEANILDDLFKDLFRSSPELLQDGMVGKFNHIEDIQKFSFSLCQKLDLLQVHLLDSSEYIKIIDESFDVTTLKEKLGSSGNVMKNVEKKGLPQVLGKFFN